MLHRRGGAFLIIMTFTSSWHKLSHMSIGRFSRTGLPVFEVYQCFISRGKPCVFALRSSLGCWLWYTPTFVLNQNSCWEGKEFFCHQGCFCGLLDCLMFLSSLVHSLFQGIYQVVDLATSNVFVKSLMKLIWFFNLIMVDSLAETTTDSKCKCYT